ncbi:electron transport complex RsxE subunit [Candidatus Tenderia electrophaga]|jgi:electron transport complex protein RnfE|uniref:Ion-translocating oxidoreductase complex subunit E n=1 Tax=Candidatus Tenderia electrophaga TaxID=1748243 RepID=A0A0S2TBI6_9GAMM|nr:electron transport complex RsxE subunit [Candidatus Tenderia electrophaga]
MDKSYSDINREGLWSNNVALVQILGLCPLLAVTSTTINGIGLGIATTLTLVLSSLIVSLIRNQVKQEVRIPVFVMIIASVVTAIELAMNAYFHELYKILGIFVPLIVTNCAILGRAEAFASKNTPAKSALDGLMMGVGFAAVLIVLGAMREILGHGTLMTQAHLMFGEVGKILTLTLIEDYRGFLLAILPPGAFIGLGLLIALKNVIDERTRLKRSKPAITEAPAEAVDEAVG